MTAIKSFVLACALAGCGYMLADAEPMACHTDLQCAYLFGEPLDFLDYEDDDEYFDDEE